MKFLALIALFAAPLANAQYVAGAVFGNKGVQVAAVFKPAKTIQSSVTMQALEKESSGSSREARCEILARVTIGEIYHHILVVEASGNIIDQRMLETRPLVLTASFTDYKNPDCTGLNKALTSTVYGEFANENFGDLFGQKGSALQVAMTASLPAIQFQLQEGGYKAVLDTQALAQLSFNASFAYYYWGADDTVGPTLKESQNIPLFNYHRR